jgi:hypothetical protein
MVAEDSAADAQRYRALRAWLIAEGKFVQLPPEDSQPFVMADMFHGRRSMTSWTVYQHWNRTISALTG